MVFNETLEDREEGVRVGYADDTNLLVETSNDLQALVDAVDKIGCRYGLTINFGKPKFMVIIQECRSN